MRENKFKEAYLTRSMRRVNCIEVEILCQEVNRLRGARVKGIYQEGSKLSIYLKSAEIVKNLVIFPGEIFYLSNYEPKKEVSNFCLQLRKYLLSSILIGCEQINFERIVRLRFFKANEFNLFLEFIPRGNVVLCDSNFLILAKLYTQTFKDREIREGKIYKLPPSRGGFPQTFQEFVRRVRTERGEIVRALALQFPLGKFAEKLLELCGIDKHLSSTQLPEELLEKLFHKLNELITKAKKLEIAPGVFENSELEFSAFREEGFRAFETLSEAIEYCMLREERRMQEKIIQAERERIKRILEDLTKRREELLHNSKKLREVANKIMWNLEYFKQILIGLDEARRRYSLQEINRKISELDFVERVEGDGIIIQINHFSFKLRFGEDPYLIAERLFTSAKRFEDKLKKVEQKIKEFEEKLKHVDEIEIPSPTPIKFSRKEWFEKFRWFRSSEGFLVIAGKDASQNELIFKKYLEPNDLVLHAEIKGSPLVVIKNGKIAGESTIAEAANFTACFSRAWKINVVPRVYWVYREQVKKLGSFPLGSFSIEGTKHFIEGIELKLAISFEEINGRYRVVYGPENSIKKFGRYVVVIPGKRRKEELAREILKLLKVELSLDELITALPGEAEIGDKVL
ncbi:MAG: ribosome rescue protein RqcH [Candidatus Nanoarchaeia archaeon]|nr:ribosome rescue protein RqcH [Candidatus Haiyanarchaeum thermophilum]MCW1303263.1 ribosome rescue protein RqcH [Candidatus Haiyanarchaeum thermophilum]MCW1304005.1 ribosome rescue protein RqcH [Candidatus Haiyanarchaeum thermophilum]MCW1306423.1 ribosome rescue protein RqcH [Candidatus Haiyanarchaeum thermophilum]MCW1307279.1 ribosome rescue protein RqcH [Candidatus Haiyanarchaeum thermophilum]